MIKEALKEQVDYLNTLTDYKITTNDFSKILVYLIENKIVAFLDYSVMYEKIEINYIYVLENYRRQGIAFKLINYIMNQNDFENITLEVNVLNEKAINLYKKLGFEIISTRKKYYGNTDGYLMERRK